MGHKGGREANTKGRRCLCNALLAAAGMPQKRPHDYVEPPIVTSGNDFETVALLAGSQPDGRPYPARAVIDYLEKLAPSERQMRLFGQNVWQREADNVEQTERSRRFINDHRPAMLLILGPGQTWQSRLIDTVGDTHIAHSMVKAIAEHFVVPKAPDPAELMHRAIRCLESLWQLSFQRHGSVTDEMAVETNKVMIAYLRIYWPELMEPAATQIDAHGADT